MNKVLPRVRPAAGPVFVRFTYRDKRGAILGHTDRVNHADGSKEIRQHAIGRMGGFVKPYPLYGLDRLAAAPRLPVLVVEGEQKCDAAQALLAGRFVVMAWPGGAKSAKHVDWSPLKGRAVTCWPDADKPGTEAMQTAARLLAPIAASVKVMRVPVGKPEGWDVGDAIVEGSTGPDLLRFIDALSEAGTVAAGPYDLAAASLARFSGTPQPIRYVVQDVIPEGVVGLLYGPGGVGKSTLAFDLACRVALDNADPWCGAYALAGGSGHVFYLASEDIETAWHLLLSQACIRFGPKARAQLIERLHLMNVYGQARPLFTVKGDTLETTPEYERLRLTLELLQGRIRLLIIDGRSRLCGTEGAGNGLVPLEVAALERLALRFGVAILLLHHSQKSTYGTQSDARAAARGESALLDSCRFGIYLRDMDTTNAQHNDLSETERRETLALTVSKCSYARPPADVVLRRGVCGDFVRVTDVKLNPSKGDRERMQETKDRDVVLALVWKSPGESGRTLRDQSPLSRQRTLAALSAAVDDGLLSTSPGPHRALLYTLSKPENQRSSGPVSGPVHCGPQDPVSGPAAPIRGRTSPLIPVVRKPTPTAGGNHA